ncbi:hypothetical protein [Ammoniphilus sp. 3BR4]|uniref:hypothetical protein n=1 Tax=Ammoniphilus sp. 3BR4 TaxID=3158265 RepID=UPI003466E264
MGNEHGHLRIYPECFIFHVGKCHGVHRQIEVWPPNREIIIEGDPKQILEAINDRGITRVLVEDIPPSSPTLLRETISSAEQRIVIALVYSSTRRVNKPMSGYKQSDCRKLVLAALKNSMEMKHFFENKYQMILQGRKGLVFNGLVTETY